MSHKCRNNSIGEIDNPLTFDQVAFIFQIRISMAPSKFGPITHDEHNLYSKWRRHEVLLLDFDSEKEMVKITCTCSIHLHVTITQMSPFTEKVPQRLHLLVPIHCGKNPQTLLSCNDISTTGAFFDSSRE